MSCNVGVQLLFDVAQVCYFLQIGIATLIAYEVEVEIVFLQYAHCFWGEDGEEINFCLLSLLLDVIHTVFVFNIYESY